MKTVTVPRDELLKIIKENREKHREIFLNAQQGYRAKFIEILEERLVDAASGRHFSQHIGLVEPMDMTKEYDRVIAMLEMSVDKNIDLDSRSFASYVMDDWDWKNQFVAANSYYTEEIG